MEKLLGSPLNTDPVPGRAAPGSDKPLPDYYPAGVTPGGISPSNVSLSEIVAALSFALDLTEGAMPGHAIRSCLLGMRIAEALYLSTEEKSDLYYALLLKDVGCSSNAARLREIVGGDDRKTTRDERLRRWAGPPWATIGALWSSALPGSAPLAKIEQRLEAARQSQRTHAEMIAVRAERGASIIAKIGLSARAAQSIRHLDERWNGSGDPGNLRGECIPLGARIVSIAQHLDVFRTAHGADAAMEVLKQRSGLRFDPQLVKLAQTLHRNKQLWTSVEAGVERERVLALDPGLLNRATTIQIDKVCEAFAQVVDAKSSFTYEHSLGVTRTASMIAQQLGLDPDRQRLVYRAALLHDIGKLRVPNSILDKPGKLDAGEWKVIREHPQVTLRILQQITKFEVIAITASQHHERLDGSGYPDGLRGEHLSIEARVIAVADVYGALSEHRPYRNALGMDEIMSIMGREVPDRLDSACFDALQGALKRTGGVVRCANGETLSSSSPFASRSRSAFTHAS